MNWNGALDRAGHVIRLELEPEALAHFKTALEAAGLLTHGPSEEPGIPADAVVVGVGEDGRGLLRLEASVRHSPQSPHVAWSASGAARLINASFGAGAVAYVWGEAHAVAQELADALCSLIATQKGARAAPAQGSSPFDEFLPRAQQLSPRERQVLAFIASGMDNLQIAAHLGVCERTVKSHVTALYRKLAQENRAQLALLGARLGLGGHQPQSNRAQASAL